MHEALIARQPIFDRHLDIHGYELLYRGTAEAEEAGVTGSGEAATSAVLVNWATGLGMHELTGGHMAFVNVSRTFLHQLDHVTPASCALALEIPAAAHTDAELLPTLKALREAGYTIALEGSSLQPMERDLLLHADLVKVDVRTGLSEDCADSISDLKARGIGLVAEKVETQECLDHCRRTGFDFFQGFFFTRPELVSRGKLPADRMQLIRLLGQINDPETTLPAIADVIAHDVDLSYRLLRLVNSPLFPTRVEVDTVQQAVSLLGLDRIRTYASWLAMTRSSRKPSELSITLLVRGRFAELLGLALRRPESAHAFTVGLFSGLDALTDTPLEEALEPLPFSEPVRQALLERAGPLGELLNAVLAYERGDFNAPDLAGTDPHTLHQAYLKATQWADELADR